MEFNDFDCREGNLFKMMDFGSQIQNPKAFSEVAQDMIHRLKMEIYDQKTKSMVSDIDFDTSNRF